MDHVAGAHEEQGLEERVREKVEERGRVGADSDGDEHVADLAHRGVGEDALDVGLHDRDRGRHQRRDGADQRHSGVGVDGDVIERVQAADQVDAGGDHRGGVDEGADRGRALHRIRQPGVQRDLGRLGDGADQEEKGGQLQRSRVLPWNRLEDRTVGRRVDL